MAESPSDREELRRVLGRGGDRYAARLLRGKQSAFNLFKSISSKFGTTASSVIDSVISLARSGMAAGRLLNASERKGPIDPDQIPTNPYLFGGDSGKGRAIIMASFGLPGEPPARDVSIILPSSLGWEDINEAISSQIDFNRSIGTDEWLLTHNLRTQEMAVGIWYGMKQF